MIICSGLLLKTDVKESLFELLLGRTEWKAEVFVARSSSEEENLHHRQRQVVIILAGGGEFESILSELGGELFQVFPGVLTWKA